MENSELEVMRAKIKKLEAKVEELQRINNGQVDQHEDQKNDAVDFLLVFMNNNGFKQIAYKILSFLDCKSFFLLKSHLPEAPPQKKCSFFSYATKLIFEEICSQQ